MADAYISLGVAAFGPLEPLDARRLAKQAALKALELDPNLAEAHTSLAFAAFFHDWDWPRAEVEFQRAFSSNPQYALAHHWYADYLNAMGRQSEAMSEILKAQELEPLSIIIHRDVAWHLFFQRRYDEAIDHLHRTLEMDPGYAAARTLLARALAERGRYPEALQELKRAEDNGLARGPYLSFAAYVQAASGNRSGADDSLREIARVRATEYVPPYYDALVYVAERRFPKALDSLEQAYREQDSTLVSLKMDPRLEPIRGELRYRALVAKMKFPE
jgi:tetratricopeptide (TPR) repeat protein